MIQIIPTDTCYGLAWEFCEKDYQDIYRLKGRDFSKQLAFLVRDFGSLREYAEITDEQITFLKTYPRPWSVILQKRVIWNLQIFLIKKSITKYLSVLRKCVYMRIFAIIYSTHFFLRVRISLGIQNQNLSPKREEFFYELMALMVVSAMSHHRIFLSLGKIIRLFFFEKILNKNLYGD